MKNVLSLLALIAFLAPANGMAATHVAANASQEMQPAFSKCFKLMAQWSKLESEKKRDFNTMSEERWQQIIQEMDALLVQMTNNNCDADTHYYPYPNRDLDLPLPPRNPGWWFW